MPSQIIASANHQALRSAARPGVSSGLALLRAALLFFPQQLGRVMQRGLDLAHEPLEAPLGLFFGGQHVRKGGRVAEVDQQGHLLRGEAKQVLPLQVCDLHGQLANASV
jgi:hypothetical protein